jgi:hypothetical protein
VDSGSNADLHAGIRRDKKEDEASIEEMGASTFVASLETRMKCRAKPLAEGKFSETLLWVRCI